MESIILSLSGPRPGRVAGREPVAMMQCLNLKVWVPWLFSTETRSGAVKWAVPCTTATWAWLSRPSTPLRSLPTISSFQAMVRARSTPSRRAPIPRAPAVATVWAAAAARISALDGMQPRFRQTPPTASASIRVTSRPASPRRAAAL